MALEAPLNDKLWILINSFGLSKEASKTGNAILTDSKSTYGLG